MKFIYILILFLSAVSAAQYFDHNEAERVIGGEEALEGQFPWNAAIKYQHVFICSGALISVRHILTSAECLKPYVIWANYINIKLGNLKWLKEEEVKEYVSLRIDLHPDYSRDSIFDLSGIQRDVTPHNNNIAVITLKEEVELSDNVQIIALATIPLILGTKLQLSGWGAEDGTIERYLKFSELRTMDTEECLSLVGGGTIDLDTNICTVAMDPVSGHNATACLWDNGAPLVHIDTLSAANTVLHGLVSYGVCDINKMTPTIYSSVIGYRKFIEDIIGVNSS